MEGRAERRHKPAEEIGEEILEEIVLGLPLKSIIRFSCVSKSWRSIIFESRFINRHHVRARERILAIHGRNIYSGYVSPKTTSIEYTGKLISLPSGKKLPFCVGVCHGLLCMNVDDEILLWNPSTSTYKKLPPSPSKAQQALAKFVVGLGYDAVGDDYKLLLIPNDNGRRKKSELYSLKSNSWRKIPSYHKSTRVLRQPCAFVNGALHWVDFHPNIIVCFNLWSHKYVELAAPKYDLVPNYAEVSVLKGRLCVIQSYKKMKVVVWLMDYRWIKMAEIDYEKSLAPYPHCQMRAVYLYDEGDILLQIKSLGTRHRPRGGVGVYIYHIDQGKLNKLDACQGEQVYRAHLYIESLMRL